MQLYFPQLATGASAQFPLHKRRYKRTIENLCLDGRVVRLPDPGAAFVEWSLSYDELPDLELEALKKFFVAVEGTFGSFTFLDPTANLLSWSDDFTKPVWERSSLLTVTPNADDPWGGKAATTITNGASGPVTLRQTLNGPGWFTYCFSAYARSASPAGLSLRRLSGADTQVRDCALDTSWRRYHVAGKFDNSNENAGFEIEIDADTTVDLGGVQVEAQPAPSGYKRSSAAGGVFEDCRFLDDNFSFTTIAPDRSRCALRILAREIL